jgi:hypothetical protein
MMSSKTYSKFSSRSDSRRPGSSSHRSLPPVLDLTSALCVKSICVPINSLPFSIHISYNNVLPDVRYVFPQRISQEPSRCTQERVWLLDCRSTRLSCSHPLISTPVVLQNNHHVLIMFYVNYDIMVQTVSPFTPSIIRNV